MVTAPYLIDTFTNGSKDVVDKIIDAILERNSTDPVIDLSNSSTLSSVFKLTGSESVTLLKPLADANAIVKASSTIEGQVEGQFAGQDDVLQARTTVDLNSSTRSQSDPFSDNNEKIIGSDDDDIVFASKGNDLFTLVKEGDTFIGGDGNDTAVVEGKSSDYVFMTEETGSMRYTVVEAMLAQGDLGAKKLLVMQKAVDGTGLIFLQTENIRFSGDSSRLTFDDTTGEIKGGSFGETIRGTDNSADLLKGEGGNDIIVSYGGPSVSSIDVIEGGLGNDTLISVGANTKATGGSGSDYFAYGARSGSFSSNGKLEIMDFKAAEDKLDFSLFKTATDSVLSIADILANSSSATVDGQSGVEISFTDWKFNGGSSGTGSIFIKGASLTLDESSVKQSIKDQDNVILTTTVLDLASSYVDLSNFNYGDLL